MRDALAAVAMLLGGLTLTSTLLLEPRNAQDFWTYTGAQGLGVALLLAASILTSPSRRSRPARRALIFGSGTWILCWSSFFLLAVLIPVPLAFWAGLASAAYLAAAGFFARARRSSAALSTSALALGSIAATVVLVAHPATAPDDVYVPVGLGAVVAGVLTGAGAVAARRRALRREGLLPSG